MLQNIKIMGLLLFSFVLAQFINLIWTAEQIIQLSKDWLICFLFVRLFVFKKPSWNM